MFYSSAQEFPHPTYDLEASQEICELQVSQLLLTKAGRTSLMVSYPIVAIVNFNIYLCRFIYYNDTSSLNP